MLSDVIMKTVRVVFLIRNIFNLAEFFSIQPTETIRQRLAWSRVNTIMIAALRRPLYTGIVQFLND